MKQYEKETVNEKELLVPILRAETWSIELKKLPRISKRKCDRKDKLMWEIL